MWIDASWVSLVVLVLAVLLGAVAHFLGRRVALGVGAVLVGWLALTAALGAHGLLGAPRFLVLPATTLTALVVLSRTAALRRLRDVLPPHWPPLAQSFRVGVELLLFALFVAGRAPEQVTFEGRNADVLVGLTGPLVAWLVASGRLSARGLVAWNVASLAVLLNTVLTVASSAPGPLRLDWGGAPFAELTGWPLVWLPAFLVPVAVFLHVLSLRQALSLLRRAPSWT